MRPAHPRVRERRPAAPDESRRRGDRTTARVLDRSLSVGESLPSTRSGHCADKLAWVEHFRSEGQRPAKHDAGSAVGRYGDGGKRGGPRRGRTGGRTRPGAAERTCDAGADRSCRYAGSVYSGSTGTKPDSSSDVSHAVGNTFPNRFANANAHAIANANGFAYAHAHANGDTHADTDCYAHADADADHSTAAATHDLAVASSQMNRDD